MAGPTDFELRHASFERARFQTEHLRGAAVAPHAPSGFLENGPDMIALDLGQPLAAARRAQSRARRLDDESRAGRDDDRALDDVPKLPDIAGPRVSLEREDLFLRNGLDSFAQGFRKFFDEAPGQYRNVLLTFAERRHRDRKDIEPVVQVLPERQVGDGPLEITVGGGNHARVDGNRTRAAEALDLTLLQHAQQLDLHVAGQLADLVEEDGRAIGDFESTDLPG